MASSSDDKTVRIWDLITNTQQYILRDHANRVWGLKSLSFDILASASYQEIKIWNSTSGQIINTLTRTGHKSYIFSSLDVMSDGQTLVSGSVDQTIKLWNWETGECLNTINTGLNIYSLVTIKSKIVSTFKLFFFYSHRHRPVIQYFYNQTRAQTNQVYVRKFRLNKRSKNALCVKRFTIFLCFFWSALCPSQTELFQRSEIYINYAQRETIFNRQFSKLCLTHQMVNYLFKELLFSIVSFVVIDEKKQKIISGQTLLITLWACGWLKNVLQSPQYGKIITADSSFLFRYRTQAF